VKRRSRRVGDVALSLGTGLAAALVLLIVVVILGDVVYNGAPHMTLTFLTQAPRDGMTAGGIFPAIFGTVALVVLMTLAVLPAGVATAIYLSEYANPGSRLTRLVRVAVNNLAGVPSIVFGLFGLGFFIYGIGGAIDRVFFRAALPAPTFGTGGILWASLTLALLTVALRATVFTDAAFSFRSVNSSNQVTAASLAFTNDKDGAIIVNAAGLRPGKSQAGTATLTIAGTAAGRYTLSRTSLTDLPSGTQLSATLTLLVEDITGTATTLYNGTVAAFSSISLGSLSPGAQKVYRFTVSFPLAGANPVLQGASTSLALRFLAVSP